MYFLLKRMTGFLRCFISGVGTYMDTPDWSGQSFCKIIEEKQLGMIDSLKTYQFVWTKFEVRTKLENVPTPLIRILSYSSKLCPAQPVLLKSRRHHHAASTEQLHTSRGHC